MALSGQHNRAHAGMRELWATLFARTISMGRAGPWRCLAVLFALCRVDGLEMSRERKRRWHRRRWNRIQITLGEAQELRRNAFTFEHYPPLDEATFEGFVIAETSRAISADFDAAYCRMELKHWRRRVRCTMFR